VGEEGAAKAEEIPSDHSLESKRNCEAVFLFQTAKQHYGTEMLGRCEAQEQTGDAESTGEFSMIRFTTTVSTSSPTVSFTTCIAA
jgi:hypothetical protein